MDRTSKTVNAIGAGAVMVVFFIFGFILGKITPTHIQTVTSDGDTTELTVSSHSLTRIPCGTTYIVKK
nr:hypothetical protein [uncultured Flavobacterium sp.]